MKFIKYSALALATVLTAVSCQNDVIEHPAVGDVKVSFQAASIEADLTTDVINLKLTAESQSDKGAQVNVAISDVAITALNDKGEEVPVEVTEYNFILTSDVIYLPAYNAEKHGDNLPSKNVEIRVPDYRTFQSISFKATISGPNAGAIAEVTYVAAKPKEIPMEGSYTLAADDGKSWALDIEKVSDTEYNVFMFGGDADPYKATRDGNKLTIEIKGITYGQYSGVLMCAFHEHTDGNVYLWPDEACVWDFAENGFTVNNGVFLGLDQGGGRWGSFVTALPGCTATR